MEALEIAAPRLADQSEDKIAVVERFRRTWLDRLGDGRLRPIVDSTFPLAEAARAHERMERNENVGKIVLRVERS